MCNFVTTSLCYYSGMKAREDLLLTHELRPEISEAEEESLTDAELFYDIVSFKILCVCIYTC